MTRNALLFTRSVQPAVFEGRMLPPAGPPAPPRNVADWACLCLALVACQAPAPPPSAERAERRAAEPEPAEPAPAEPEPAEKKAEPAPPPSPSAEALTAARLEKLDPSRATRTAPERYTVVMETTRGDLHMDVRRSWAPLAADRFFNLVKIGFFEDNAFFRVIDGFVAQTGLHGDPAVNQLWRTQRIADDPVTQSNLRGMVSFATSGKNGRTTQFFINLGNNTKLDALGFAPFGRVREIDKLPQLYAGYGEGAPSGRGPAQARIQREGNAYLRAEFPQLDFVNRVLVIDVQGTGAR